MNEVETEEERKARERAAAGKMVCAGWVHEHKVAGGWGIGVSELADYRKVYLRPDYHWRMVGVRVYYSPEGMMVAKKHFGVPEAEEVYRRKVEAKRAEYARWAAPPRAGTALSEVICRVVKPLLNPRMIRVMDVNGKLAHILVRTSTNFREGMLMDLGSCRLVWEEPDGHNMRSTRSMSDRRPLLYELMIPLPRYVGRWGYDESTVGYIGRSGSYFKRNQPVARMTRPEGGAVRWRTARGQG
jgi:hypothetical protein